MQNLITTARAFLVFAILLGVIYPLFIMAIGQIAFPYQANGSLLTHNDKIVGSALIAQEFTSHKYFHSRFSAIKYDATNSGGSDLAVSNPILYTQIEKHIKHIKLENELPADTKLPADMVLNSASGLDPHISLANAMLQLPRIAKHRHLSLEIVKRLINDYTDNDFFGIWGQKGVNVLQLNLALDKL
jgi:potassium-transporting ATPase KdpC subunit